MSFDPKTDDIIITIPEFRMKVSADGIDSSNEIRIVTLALDEAGVNNSAPSLFLNPLIIPKVKKWSWVKFGGQGRLVYGPKNPGKFVSYSILFVEDDSDMRNLGEKIEEVIQSNAAKLLLKTVTKVSPPAELVSAVLTSLTDLISSFLKKNKNDEIARFEGCFLRGTLPPFNIGDTFVHGQGDNKFITCPVKVTAMQDEELPALALSAQAGTPKTLSVSVEEMA